MPPELWLAVREIYAEGIATGNATLETETPDWEKWDASHRKDCRLVALAPFENDVRDRPISLGCNTVLGWAGVSPVSSRQVYRGVAEVSVYVAAAARGRGVGKALLQALVENPKLTESGPCKPAFSPRTPPASPCTNPADLEKSACGGKSASWEMFGETCSCWSAAVRGRVCRARFRRTAKS
jgi:GNAT superfamily N-acetyltransferase